MKRVVYRFFPAIAVLVLVIGCGVLFALRSEDTLTIAGGLVAGVLGFGYFVQQQRLAETHLFKELFTEFNRRYDAMNDDLNKAMAVQNLSADQEQLIVDYLNLCAEEYLFFREGCILPHVWRSWCRGMAQYLEREHIKRIWEREL